MKSSKFLVLLIFSLMFSASLRAETFFAYLSSAQEVPTNASTGTGFARVFLNESAGTITFSVNFTGLSGNQTASHIHAPAAIGANSGVALNFGAVGGTAGTITGTLAITATQIAQLRAHQGYVNVHSSAFAGGEIRGQLGIKRPVDFDGDGRQDLSVLRFPAVAPQPITYWNNNTTTGQQAGIVFGDASTDFPVPGDYDGDGRDDVAIYRAGAVVGAQGDYWILNSGTSVVQRIPFGLRGDQPVNRDYDGDGKTDLGLFRRGAATGAQAFWWIRRSSIGITVVGSDRVVPFGTTGDLVGGTTGDTAIPGDYDGDGKFDIAVYRFGGIAPNNNYIILRSSDNSVVFQPFGDFQTDWILPGDYDGDGKFDYAVARTGAVAANPMVWWIVQSSNGALRNQTFGISSDRPAQGDYDGDARTDLAVYRAGTTGLQSNFWVFRSLDNTAQVTPWGVGGDFAVNTFDAR
jgi:hypothetical protein